MITKASINSKLKQDLYRIQAFADTLSLNLMLGDFVKKVLKFNIPSIPANHRVKQTSRSLTF